MTIISDTGPIIALAKVQHLDLLKSLFKNVSIAPAVYKELMAKLGYEAEQIEKALKKFLAIGTVSPIPPEVEYTLKELGEGEKQSIVFAYNKNKSDIVLLIDDKAGRQAAKRLNIPTTGTIGVLIAAKNKGLIENITKILREMREKGYWFTDEIIETAKKLSGE